MRENERPRENTGSSKNLNKPHWKGFSWGILASDSYIRKGQYLKTGCNAFHQKNQTSTPLAFWTDKDVRDYSKEHTVRQSEIYSMGYSRTGCIFCLFGIQYEKSDLLNRNRMQLLKETHPKRYKFCIEKLRLDIPLDFINVNYI